MRHDAEDQVLEVLDEWVQALRDKDLDALSRCYADDVRVFDVGSQLAGYEALRAVWESCFPYFTAPIGTERRDLRIFSSPGMAVATFLSRMTGMESDHPSAKSWLRTTVCLAQVGDRWRIVHDHVSLPVDCNVGRPAYILDEAPGASAAAPS